MSVLLIDKKREIGRPVRCAEFIPSPILKGLPTGGDYVIQKITHMVVHSPDGKKFETESLGYMIDRERFDLALLQQAKREGVRVWTDVRFVTSDGDGVLIRGKTGEQRIRTRFIIGADGPRSRVRRLIGIPDNKCLLGIQYRCRLSRPQQRIEVFLDLRFYGGYGWFFPKGDLVNIGIGIRYQRIRNPRGILNDFVRDFRAKGRISGEPMGFVTGLIPVSGFGPFYQARTILVGDSLGITHPITGGGIPQAIISGRIAGEVVARAVKDSNTGILKEYEHELNLIYKDEYERALCRRQFMEENWEALPEIYEHVWPSFKEYYDD